MRYQGLTAPALALFVITAGGCLVVTGKSIDTSGVQISKSTLKQIEIGETSEAWLVATLGEPTSRTVVESHPDTAVLRYEYTVAKSKGSAIFLIFAGGSEEKTTTSTYFEVVDGVVSRWWTET